jgi:carbonic anhydrase/acetyltransferase-like protein (isoleucine patch superfamily)
MIEDLGMTEPRIGDTAFVAPSADIIGDVEIGENSSIWFLVR